MSDVPDEAEHWTAKAECWSLFMRPPSAASGRRARLMKRLWWARARTWLAGKETVAVEHLAETPAPAVTRDLTMAEALAGDVSRRVDAGHIEELTVMPVAVHGSRVDGDAGHRGRPEPGDCGQGPRQS